MKKRVLTVGILIGIAFLVFQVYRHTTSAKVIGSVSGAEWEYMMIGGRTYELKSDSGFSRADMGKFLGIAISGDTKFRIYSVKGDTEGRYLYRLWDWEGAVYELMD